MADPAIQRAILRGVLSLPQPILRLASGGAVVYRGGRTLDPRFQFLAHQARVGCRAHVGGRYLHLGY